MRLVENHELAAVLLAQPCALLMAALWSAVPIGSHTELLNAAMVSFQYGLRSSGVGSSVGVAGGCFSKNNQIRRVCR